MTYEQAIEDFILKQVGSLFILQTPFQVHSAWLNHQADMTQAGVEFNDNNVLAVDAADAYGKVQLDLLNSGKIAKMYYSYTMHGTDPFGKPQSQQVYGSYLVPADTRVQIGTDLK